jgi:small ligand-binding sensory domain FIST
MPFATGLSEHPVAAHAVGEATGQLLEALGEEPDLACLFVTTPHAGTIEDIAAAVRAVLRPGILIGATAVAVVGGTREIEETPALSLWGARLRGPAEPVALQARDVGGDWGVLGLHDDAAASASALVLVTDPFSFPASVLLDDLAVRHPHLAVIGGLASSARGPGGNRLVLDDLVLTEGAVGVLLSGDAAPDTVVSQGCRPIGQPLIVTKAERNMVYELAGRPALERLMEMVAVLSPEERALASRGLQCGIVIDERKLDFGRGDFLIRGVLGADRDVGAVAVGEAVPVGSTIQFQVRDAATADEDLGDLLTGRSAAGALLFTCNGRGTHLFEEADHDASAVSDLLDTRAVAGMFCAGELGPVGGRNHLHGFTASVALFHD